MDAQFSSLRQIFFPVYRREFKPFLGMCGLYFLLAFVYNLLRPLKMTLVVQASEAGAEVIPFLKVWGIIPAAFFFTYLYTKFSACISRERVFYIFCSIFASLLALFFFVFIPYIQELRLTSIASFLSGHLPHGLRGFISFIEYWHLSLFYIISEVWSPIMMAVLFWGFANETTSFEQAGRFYAFYSTAGNSSAVLSGLIGNALLDVAIKLSPSGNSSEQDVAKWVIGFSIFCIIVVICIFRRLQFWTKNLRSEKDKIPSTKKPKKEASFTLWDSFVHLAQSKYLLSLTMIVLGYNLVFNLTDVLWTENLRQLFDGDHQGFYTYLNNVTIVKGVLSTVLGLFLTQFIIRVYGWQVAAQATPFIILFTSVFFFPLVMLSDNETLSAIFQDYFSASMLSSAVFIGAIQNSTTRAAKYSIYDTTKEMAFIPLSPIMKRKAKAAIDGIGSRIGKSFGSLIIQVLLLFCTSLTETVPYLVVIVLLITVAWILAIRTIHREMRQLSKKG